MFYCMLEYNVMNTVSIQCYEYCFNQHEAVVTATGLRVALSLPFDVSPLRCVRSNVELLNTFLLSA